MFIPYSCQDIDESDVSAVVGALRSSHLTQGEEVPAFEDAVARRHQVEYAVAMNSATAALHVGCLALGLKAGDRLWTSPISFLASANCALYCGAIVDFVDIDPLTRNMSVSALTEKLEIAKRTGQLPSIVVSVDFSGLPRDLREIRALADRYGFRILDDASHGVGSSYLGKPLGSAWADATVFSFHAVKIVTSAEGGMLVTHDKAIAERARLLRSHGMVRNTDELRAPPEGPWVYEQHALGFNYRLTDIQAALGRSQLMRLDEFSAKREALASRYDQLFRDKQVRVPPRLDDRVSSWHLYVIELTAAVDKRAAVFQELRGCGIGVNVHYIPIYWQPFHARPHMRAGYCPNAEAYYRGALTLPLFPALSSAQQDHVVAAVEAAISKYA